MVFSYENKQELIFSISLAVRYKMRWNGVIQIGFMEKTSLSFRAVFQLEYAKYK